MKLLAISNPEFIPDEAELINSLFREGLVCLHIRKPESDEHEFAGLLCKISPEFRERIAIHQFHNLAHKFGIKRLHFTEKERKVSSPDVLKSLKSKSFLLSTSIHDLAEMKNLSRDFDYTFFGPVFNSISKSGYKSVLPDNFFIKSEFKKIPVIGLGGISTENLEILREMNFDGAAILGMLWREPENVIAKFREIRDVVNLMN